MKVFDQNSFVQNLLSTRVLSIKGVPTKNFGAVPGGGAEPHGEASTLLHAGLGRFSSLFRSHIIWVWPKNKAVSRVKCPLFIYFFLGKRTGHKGPNFVLLKAQCSPLINSSSLSGRGYSRRGTSP